MKILSRVLLHVNTLEANCALCFSHVEVDMAALTDWLVKLRNLVPLRKVRVEVVLTRESVESPNLTVCRESKHDCVLNGSLIRHRQGSWESKGDWVDVFIGLSAVRS